MPIAFSTSMAESSPRPIGGQRIIGVLVAEARDGGRHLLFRILLPSLASIFATISRPSPANCLRTAARVARRMAARALPVTARPSQAAGGVCASERMMSTSSPFSSSVTSGAWRPLTLAPTQLSPIEVCTA